jgi:hypothetical protein
MSPTSCQTAPPRARSTKTEILAAFRFWSQTFLNVFSPDLLLRGPPSRPPLSRFFETSTCLATGLFSLSNQRGAKSTDTVRNTQGLEPLFLLRLARFAHCFFRSSLSLFGPRIRALIQLVFSCSKQRGAKSTDAVQRAQALSANFFRAEEFQSPACVLDVIRVSAHGRRPRFSAAAAVARRPPSSRKTSA